MRKLFYFSLLSLCLTFTGTAQYIPNTGASNSVSPPNSSPDIHRSYFYEFAGSGNDLFVFSYFDNNTGGLVLDWDYPGSTPGNINLGPVGKYTAVVGDPSGSPYIMQFFKRGHDVYLNAFEFAPPNTMTQIISNQFIANAPGKLSTIEVDVDRRGNVILLLDDQLLTTTSFASLGSFGPVVKGIGTPCNRRGKGEIVDVAISTEQGGRTIVSLSTNNYFKGIVEAIQADYFDIVSGAISFCKAYTLIDPVGNKYPTSDYSAGPIAGRYDFNSSATLFAMLINDLNNTRVFVDIYDGTTLFPHEVTNNHGQNACRNFGLTKYADLTYSQDVIHVLFLGEDCRGHFNNGLNGLRKRYVPNGSVFDTDYSVLNSSFESIRHEINTHARFSSSSGNFVGTSYPDANSGSITKFRRSIQGNIQLRKKTDNNSITEADDVSNISVYPNPAHSSISFKGTDLELYSSYEIKDLSGKVVAKGKVSNTSFQQIEINNLDNGAYSIELVGNNQDRFRKLFIKQ